MGAAVRALIDDEIKGVLRSIGDAGASPLNQPGYTALYRLRTIDAYLSYMVSETAYSLLTSTPLAENASYTSSSDDRSARTHRTVIAHAYADQPGTLYIEQSPDGTNWDISESTSVAANTGTALITVVKSKYVRIRYVNGANAQTVFRLAKRLSFA
jgi:hypothetical protein